jgi:hypothetical protein
VRILTCFWNGIDVDCSLEKPIYGITHQQSASCPFKTMCSYRGINIHFSSVQNGQSELSVQCQFSKVRGDSAVVGRMLNTGESEEVSDTDSSLIMVAQGDYVTLETDKVYVVTEVNDNDGTVRCVSPANPISNPIVISIEEAIEAL